MTTGNFYIKWGAYALAVLPVCFLDAVLLGWIPFAGASPIVLPLCAIMVAVMEGGLAGAGFGLLVGVLCDAVLYGGNGWWTLSLPILGAIAGIASRYGLRQNLVGCLLCSIFAIVVIDVLRIVHHLFYQVAPLSDLLAVAVPELLWSLLFVFPLYYLFRWVFHRVPKRTVF